MDHIVYVDAKEGDLEKLLDGSKTMIIRGAAGRKLPHGRVAAGDRLYFALNNGDGQVRACAAVTAAFHSEKLSEEASRALVAEHQGALALTPAQTARWAGKRFLVLVTLGPVKALEPFAFDRSAYGSMDDWLPVGDITAVCR